MVRGIHSYHPFVLLFYYILAIAGLMMYKQPVFLGVSLLLIIVLNYMLDRGRALQKWVWAITVMGLIIFVLTPFFNRRGNHILFYLFDNQVMLEAVIRGAIIALTLTGILALFVTFNILLTADRFLYLFARFMPQWALLAMLSMRFVPLLQRKVKDMENIQAVKGLSIRQGSVRQRAQHGMQLLQMLLTGSLEDSIQSADSMTARGYGLRKRSNYRGYSMKTRDWIALAYLSIAGAVLFHGWQLGLGTLQLLPELDPFWQGGMQYILLGMWILLIGFPILAEGKEVIKWLFYRQTTSHSPTRTP